MTLPTAPTVAPTTPSRPRPSSIPALMMCAMVVASDFEVRQRDVNAALGGSVDIVVLVDRNSPWSAPDS